ncbi:high-affinity branched-chain amino acid ABC transporter ATP-binding protein LivG [Rhizobium leguminosarum bv. trifolii]|uniref:ABC transporter ATP-binding protein n=1 Tax=Rhizobium leguminosarum TaxID=384 RepID=UPI000E2FDB46|nr:ABC transporter ATP-binding protein [Rhizobium leguminosarum]RFB88817.1 high-affinity branched-chain amino acid ABC transporter ATP-binding protein LivG [Rhizobium leguminosarum bv. trifolii]
MNDSSIEEMRPVLQARDVSVQFGGVKALTDVSLSVKPGEICGLIGPNGAGKSTFLNAATRLVNYATGSIVLDGQPLEGVETRNMIGMGVARTFQNLGIYASMTVLENVMLGAHHRLGGKFATTIFAPFHVGALERIAREKAMAILDEVGMADLAARTAGSLPYPLQKRMEIARALASEPKILLLDEPAGGLTHGEVHEFGALVDGIRRRRNLSILLIEHHMGLVMSLCDRIVVFHLGRNLAEGTPAEIKSNDAVIAAYLGKAA